MMKTVLRANKISKDFNVGDAAVHALKDVSFEIYEGEIVVILGPSGSGKSTLLNILGGIETATDGELEYEGTSLDWNDQKSLTDYRRRHIGFVFQFYNLLPGLTVLENVELAAGLTPDPFDAKKLVGEVGLSDRSGHFPAKLSGGEQQRVTIARALCKNPDVLLCDEPTGALDSRTSVQVLELLWNFNRNYKKTLLIITHNAKIAEIADRVFYMRDGSLERIEANETPKAPGEVDWT